MAHAPTPPPEPPAEEGDTRGHRRILVVDDNQDSAKTLATVLRLTGNEVRTAFDGMKAVEAAEAFHPDVAVLDIGLPELNGYDVARRIRQEPWGREIVLIALTGWGQEADKREARAAGFNHHLVKPVNHAALQKLLADHCSAT
jgi:CheY-like chemotaxis protein